MRKELLFGVFLLFFQLIQISVYAQNILNNKIIKTYIGSFPILQLIRLLGTLKMMHLLYISIL